MRLCRAHTVPGSIGGSAKAPPPHEFHTGWRRTFIYAEPGQAAVTVILSHCLLKTGLIIRPAGAISVGSEQVTLIIRANWVACSYVIHLLTLVCPRQKKILKFFN